MDRLIGIGSTFDWITPLYSIVRDVFRGGKVIMLPKQYTLDAQMIAARYNVKTWAWQVVGDHILFHVGSNDVALFEREFWGGS